MVPVAVGYIPAAIILVGLYFTPESPRWLVSKGHTKQALESLDRLRPRSEIDNGTTVAEVDALEEVAADSGTSRTGRWIDLFGRKYIRRTMVSPSPSSHSAIPRAFWPDQWDRWIRADRLEDLGVAFHLRPDLGSAVCWIIRTDVSLPLILLHQAARW